MGSAATWLGSKCLSRAAARAQGSAGDCLPGEERQFLPCSCLCTLCMSGGNHCFLHPCCSQENSTTAPRISHQEESHSHSPCVAPSVPVPRELMPVALTMQQPSWELLRKVSEGHEATLCLEKQSWNSSPSCPDILLLPNDTDETRSSALCVTAVGTIPQPCDTSACSGSLPVSAGAAEGAASQPSQTLQSKLPPAASEPLLPQPSLQHWQQSLVLFTPFPFFFLFPLNASFLVLSTCTCRAGNPPAHPGWGPQDPLGSAPGCPGRSCSDNGTKPWLQHPR